MLLQLFKKAIVSGEVESDNERVIDLPPMPIAYNVRELNVVIHSGQLQLVLATGWSQQQCFNCNVLSCSLSTAGRIFAQSAKSSGFQSPDWLHISYALNGLISHLSNH